MPLFHRCLFAWATALALAASPASATWSILIADTRTGEIVIASATCVETIDLRRETPVLITGIGAVTAQSAVDGSGFTRMLIRDRLLQGVPLESVLEELAERDAGHDNRQYGIITAEGETLTYSGILNADWAGGLTGRIERGELGLADDIVYSVQGNILSGPNVVNAAAEAIVNTDADLPGKLMAAMLAAQEAGGDGRCSCSPAMPTGCGSPPPGPFKSAHVGYMIGARADDTDSIRAFYDLPAVSTALTQLGDTQFATSDTNGDIHIYNNATNTGDEVAHFNFQQTIETDLPSLTKLTAADLDNNGLDDIISLSNERNIAILLQTEPNTFAPPIIATVPIFGDSIADIKPIRFINTPADQLLITFNGGYRTFILQNKTLVQTFSYITESNHSAIQFADLNNDGIQDLLNITLGANHFVRTFRGTETGTFASQPFPLNTSNDPIQLRTADINNDGLLDILVATGLSRSIDAFINIGTPENPSFAPLVSSPIASGAIDFQITDLNDDGIPDAIVLLESGANLRYYLGDGAGNFAETNRTRIGGTPTDAILADLNNDGDMDLITNASNQILIYDNLENATVQRQTGFARGDKFMFLNIANQRAADPDPVDQLAEAFDGWRAGLAGKVDAVRSKVIGRHRLPSGQHTFITIELRDWQGELLPITDPTWSFQSVNGFFSTQTPTLVEPGVFELRVGSVEKVGPDELIIRVGSGADQIRLMPSHKMFFANNIADFTADGVLDFFDVSAFLHAFYTQSPDADLNGDGVFSNFDLSEFLSAFSQG